MKYLDDTTGESVDAWQWRFTDQQEPPPVWVIDAMMNWPRIPSVDFRPDALDGPAIVVAAHRDPRKMSFGHGRRELPAGPGSWLVRFASGEVFPFEAEEFPEFFSAIADEPTRCAL